jgi:hypothetical protein
MDEWKNQLDDSYFLAVDRQQVRERTVVVVVGGWVIVCFNAKAQFL